MKRMLIILAFHLFSTNFLFSQISVNATDCGLTYLYDNAGNRIARVWISCQLTGKKSDDDTATIQNTTFDDLTEKNSLISEIEISVLYPNPTAGNFSIVFNQEITDARVLLATNSGMTIYDFKYSGKEIPIDISSLSSGIYYVSIYVNKKWLQKSVVKQ